MPASALAGAPPLVSSHEVRATRLVLIASLVVLAILSWFLRDVLIGVDKRISTSKTTAAVWTYLVAGSLLGFVVAKFFGYPQALESMMHSGLAGQYGLLVGGTLGGAIAAKGLVTNQLGKNSAAKSSGEGTPLTAGQLVQNDAGETDLGDFQYILFNLVAMVYFLGTLIESPTAGFPHIPDILLGLTSVSAAAYVTKKALPSTAPSARLAPSTAAEGAAVTITGTGLLSAEEPRATALSVLFGEVEAAVSSKERVEAEDRIQVVVPAGLSADRPVPVIVITPAPARVNAGTFTLG